MIAYYGLIASTSPARGFGSNCLPGQGLDALTAWRRDGRISVLATRPILCCSARYPPQSQQPETDDSTTHDKIPIMNATAAAAAATDVATAVSLTRLR
jgi:hypothetical protein